MHRMAPTEQLFTHRLELMHELSFELTAAVDIDQLCRAAVDRGRRYIGLDRIGLWFLDTADPEWFTGSYGIDENGAVRDERDCRVPRDPEIYDERLLQRQIPFLQVADANLCDQAHGVIGHGDLVIAPMWNGSTSIGVVAADNALSDRPLNKIDCHLVALMARIVGHLVTIKRSERRLRETASRLEHLATIDELTGLLNRRTGIEILRQQIRMACRNEKPITVCFLDLNGLKQVNDRDSHSRGDEFIAQVAALAKAIVRESDVVCRMGGDEFMIVLPASTAACAAAIMERLAQLCRASEALNEIKREPWYSYGLAEFDPLRSCIDAEDTERVVEALIHQADVKMYAQKRAEGSDRDNETKPAT